MTYLGSDVTSQEEYFKNLTNADPGLHSFLFESGDEIDRLYEISQEADFAYPVLVLFMPALEIDDVPGYALDAHQDNAFAILVQTTDNSPADKSEAIRQAQLIAFRIIKQIRRDARSGLFQLPEKRRWRIRPMSNVGPQRVCGVLVDLKYITNANAQIGSSD